MSNTSHLRLQAQDSSLVPVLEFQRQQIPTLNEKSVAWLKFEARSQFLRTKIFEIILGHFGTFGTYLGDIGTSLDIWGSFWTILGVPIQFLDIPNSFF